MDLISTWMHVDTFTVDQAAALWSNFDPKKVSIVDGQNPSEFLAARQLIISGILCGDIEVNSSHNPLQNIGNYSKTYVERSDLEFYARNKKLYPRFLFDTLAPFELSQAILKKILPNAVTLPKTEIPSIVSEQVSQAPNRGGRPQEYDWNSFTSEIIHRANQPDGLPDTQAKLTRDMLEWFVERFGSEPAESSVRERISKIYNYLENAKNRTP